MYELITSKLSSFSILLCVCVCFWYVCVCVSVYFYAMYVFVFESLWFSICLPILETITNKMSLSQYYELYKTHPFCLSHKISTAMLSAFSCNALIDASILCNAKFKWLQLTLKFENLPKIQFLFIWISFFM